MGIPHSQTFKPLTPTDTTQCHCDYTVTITIRLRLSSNKPIFHHGCGGSFKGGSGNGIPTLLAYYVCTNSGQMDAGSDPASAAKGSAIDLEVIGPDALSASNLLPTHSIPCSVHLCVLLAW